MLLNCKKSRLNAINLVFLMAASVVAQNPGRGGNQPPPNSPVKFTLHWLGNGSALDMNEDGVIVGTSMTYTSGVATIFGTGMIAQDLNDGAQWLDLDDPQATLNPSEWLAVQASGINNSSQVVGKAVSLLGEERLFLISDPFAEDRVIKLLPSKDGQGTSLGTPQTWGPNINDQGIIATRLSDSIVVFSPSGSSYIAENTNVTAGRVDAINNEGMIVGWAYAGDSLESVYGIRILADPINSYSAPIVDYLPGYWLRGLSNGNSTNVPMICGDRLSSGNGRNRKPAGPIRLPAYGDASTVEFLAGSGDFAYDINGNGDCITQNGWLYHNTLGTIDLRNSNAVTNADSFFRNNTIRSWHLSERITGTNSGMIAGYSLDGFSSDAVTKVFLLIPDQQ